MGTRDGSDRAAVVMATAESIGACSSFFCMPVRARRRPQVSSRCSTGSGMDPLGIRRLGRVPASIDPHPPPPVFRPLPVVAASAFVMVAPLLPGWPGGPARAQIMVQPAQTVPFPQPAQTVPFPQPARTADVPSARSSSGGAASSSTGRGATSSGGGSGSTYQPQFWQQTYTNGNTNPMTVPGW